MGDYSSNKSKTIKKVYLTFLQSKPNNSIHTPRPTYCAPDTDVFNKPRAYNELKYMIHNTELRIKFYFNVLRRFCIGGMDVMSLFAGAKFTCAALVFVV